MRPSTNKTTPVQHPTKNVTRADTFNTYKEQKAMTHPTALDDLREFAEVTRPGSIDQLLDLAQIITTCDLVSGVSA